MNLDALYPWLFAIAAIIWLVITWQQNPSERRIKRTPPPPAEPPPFLPNDIAVEMLDIGVMYVSADGVVLHHNPALRTVLRIDGGVDGQTIMSLVRDHQLDEFVRDTATKRVNDEMQLHQRNPSRTMRVVARPMILPNEDVVVMVLIRDVTQINQLERARRDMIVSISHELRTPLAALKILSDTIVSQPPPEVAQRMAMRISDEVDALTRLVEDLHDLSQIEAGRIALQYAQYDTVALIQQAIERSTPQANAHYITVQATYPDNLPAVMVDRGRMAQVFLNLLHNAVKFTPDHGAIRLDARVVHLPSDGAAVTNLPADHPPGEWMLLSIADNGVGIPLEHQHRIFERFYKVDQARTRGSGTGLGLAIVRHLVEGHGGRVWLSSTVGYGTTFFFTIPTAQSNE
ncbi:MAG: PAS domain-containing sensor histidine kinase [Chloroflexi bacterium]|nr:MAG: PAS domain-containing sensor histidine kinase [Chloroflexota bacterium]RLT34177.1 MAG: PAS domain-containing sensor histidine kinase [Chloroflexota bacterium]